MLWEHLFSYWFQGPNLLADDQNFKMGGDIKNREDQILRWGVWGLFFLFHQSKIPIILVSPDTALKERCLG